MGKAQHWFIGASPYTDAVIQSLMKKQNLNILNKGLVMNGFKQITYIML